jgi:hypothetical protein
MVSYKVNRIGCDTLEGTLIAGVGNESIGYVMFQRGTTSETGKDEAPYFEFYDQFHGGTGFVESVELSENLLAVHIDKTRFAIEVFQLTLDAEPEVVKQLASQLKKIFAGYEERLHISIT